MNKNKKIFFICFLSFSLSFALASCESDKSKENNKERVLFVNSGYYHSCALLDDKSVKCWGDNYYGGLGLGDKEDRGDGASEMGDDLPAVDLGAGRTAMAIAVGYYHTCALLDDSSVKCWGLNHYGHLGLGDKGQKAYYDEHKSHYDTGARGRRAIEMGDNLPAVDLGTGRTATAIVGGGHYTCALLDDSSVKCWGYNHRGQLGLGDIENRGDGADEMGDNLPAVDLGTGRTAIAIAAGSRHACAILDDKSVKCWGRNNSGRLGLGDTDNRGDGADEMGDDLPAVDLGTGRTAIAIAAGGGHTCAILDDKSVKCWGRNYYGQLGLGDKEDRGDGASEMGDDLPAVDLGTGRTATAIAAGGNHTCVLLDDSSVKCWGYNGHGQIGLGDTEKRGDEADEMGDDLAVVDLGTGRTATAIAAGGDHTCALLDDKSVKCWGGNYRGELGLGDEEDRGDEADEMGDNLPVVDL